MTIQKLFESLDESVFTPELKQSLSTKFNEAVESSADLKASVIADEMVESKIAELDQKAIQYGEYLLGEAEERLEKYKQDTSEKLSEYMDLVVQEFVTEARTALNESLKAEQADMLIEAFDSMLVSSGVEFAQIMEAKENLQENTSETSEARVNQLAEEVLKLKEENSELLKMGLVKEMSESLTLVQADRFARLAKLVEFNSPADFVQKLEALLESVKGVNTEDNPRITESHINENTQKSVWSHLI